LQNDFKTWWIIIHAMKNDNRNRIQTQKIKDALDDLDALDLARRDPRAGSFSPVRPICF